jgi:hypothetical protein
MQNYICYVFRCRRFNPISKKWDTMFPRSRRACYGQRFVNSCDIRFWFVAKARCGKFITFWGPAFCPTSIFLCRWTRLRCHSNHPIGISLRWFYQGLYHPFQAHTCFVLSVWSIRRVCRKVDAKHVVLSRRRHRLRPFKNYGILLPNVPFLKKSIFNFSKTSSKRSISVNCLKRLMSNQQNFASLSLQLLKFFVAPFLSLFLYSSSIYCISDLPL